MYFFLPDIMLLTLCYNRGNLIRSHKDFLSSQSMFPPAVKVLTISPPDCVDALLFRLYYIVINIRFRCLQYTKQYTSYAVIVVGSGEPD